MLWNSCWQWWTSGFVLQLSKHAPAFALHLAAWVLFVAAVVGNSPASWVEACAYGSSSNVIPVPGLRQAAVMGRSWYGLLGLPLLGCPGTQLDGIRGSGMLLGKWRYMKNGSAERTSLNGAWKGKTRRAFWNGENAKCSPRWTGAGELLLWSSDSW